MNMLKSMDYKPDIAENGLEAVKQTHAQHYDIVFMDLQVKIGTWIGTYHLQMPIMDGLEATRQIRANSTEHQPQVFYSILITTNDVIRLSP